MSVGARETKSLTEQPERFSRKRKWSAESDATERSSERMELCMWSVATKRPLVSDS